MCRVYGVTRGGYYAWRSHERSRRDVKNEQLATAIRAIHVKSKTTYGSPRVHRVLRQQGHSVGENRVARLMRLYGIKGRVATMRYTSPRMQRHYGSIPNRQADLEPKRPDEVWVGDITYLKVGAVYRYLAVVLDKCSRRVIGWSYGPRKDVKLTLQALNKAVQCRNRPAGVVFHTDRGVEYSAGRFKDRLAELRFTQSMNRPGKVTDNAYVESFFHSMKADVFHGRTFELDADVRAVLKDYLPFYNRARLHSSLDYVSPATFEQQARQTGCQ
jgi:putative transposase